MATFVIISVPATAVIAGINELMSAEISAPFTLRLPSTELIFEDHLYFEAPRDGAHQPHEQRRASEDALIDLQSGSDSKTLKG
jgi:hypothetical protein